MLSLPDKDPGSADDPQRLADWVELSCLLNESGEIWREQIADFLDNSGTLASERDELEAPAEARATDILQVLRNRAHLICDGYPFLVERDRIAVIDSWETYLSYTALLLADLGRDYRGFKYGPKTRFTFYFEHIVNACVTNLCRGLTVRFGWPRDRIWPTHPVNRVKRLSELMNVTVMDLSDVKPHDKDIGLDVVARWKMGDERPGLLIMLVQCATGQNWVAKTGEPSLQTWNGLIKWDAQLARAVAFPWRHDGTNTDLARISRKFEAVILDRYRLVSAGNPDDNLDPNWRPKIEAWCNARIVEIPAN